MTNDDQRRAAATLKHGGVIRRMRDTAETNPGFVIEAGLAALRWLARGYGYEITGADVWTVYLGVIKAAENAGRKEQTVERILALLEQEGDSFVSGILGRALRLS